MSENMVGIVTGTKNRGGAGRGEHGEERGELSNDKVKSITYSEPTFFGRAELVG